MVTVKHILESKGNQVWSVTPDTKVFEVLKLMAEKNVGTVLVIENEHLKESFQKEITQGKLL